MCPIICTLILRSFNRIDYITYKGFLKKAQAAPQRPLRALFRGERRRMSQPSERSLGSVFLRVGEKSAAYYIDQCGLKGCRIGGASVSQKHAGFIINEGNASAKDFRALIDFVRMRVKERFCVVLQTEIEIIEETEEARWLRFV